MATIVHARDVMLQDPVRVRYIRGTKLFKVSDYPWTNEYPSPLDPSLFACTATSTTAVPNPNNGAGSLVIPNGSNTVHGINRYNVSTASPLSVGAHTVSQTIYVKDDGSGTFHLHCNMRMRNSANTINRNNTIRINPVNGTVAATTTEGSTADSVWSTSPIIKIILLSGGWWKVDITNTVTVVIAGVDLLSYYFGIVQTNGNQTYAGDGVHGLYLYAPQAYQSTVDELIGDIYQDLESGSTYRWNGASWDIQYSKSQTFKQQTTPTGAQDGDIWLKTNGSGVIIEVYEYVNGVWELYPNAISGMLTKESALIECNSGGTVTGSYTNAAGNFVVYAGNVDVSTSGSVVYSVNTEAFVDATINTSTGAYTLASLTGDVGTVIFRAIYTAATGVTTTIDKKYTISKSKAGAPGTDGLDGNDGIAGINSATVYVYKRSPTTVTVPSADATYTFATKALVFAGGVNDGWLTDIVTGSDPLWVTAAVASSNTATDTIDGSDGTDGSDWSTPAKLSENGLNSATVNLFIRTSTTAVPATPTATVTYTFATGAISPTAPSGWSTTIPAPSAGKYLWVSSAVAVGPYTTDTIAAAEWNDPVITNINGANGFTLIPSSNMRIVNGNGCKKIGNTASFNEQVYSQEAFQGGAMVSGKFASTTLACAFGLNNNPSASATRDTMDYCWGIGTSGNVYAMMEGTQVYPSSGTVAGSTSNVYSIVYDNASTKFMVNGTVVYTEYNETPDQVLSFDSSFFSVNAEISDIVFAPVGSAAAPQLVISATSQTFRFDGQGNASPTAQSIVFTAALKNTSGNATFVYRLFNTSGGQIGSAVTMSSSSNTATLSVSVFTATPTAKYSTVTATLGSLTDTETIARLDDGSDNITIDLSNAAHTVPSYANGFVYDYTGANTRVKVYRGTTDVSAEAWTWTPTPSTGVTATMGSGGNNNLLTVSALTDAISSGYVDIAVSRSGYVTQTKRFTISKSKGGNPNFNLKVNDGTCVIKFPNGIDKPTGSNAWDSDVYSLEAYASGAYCSAQAMQTNCALMFGLNSDPLTSGSYLDLDYAWYIHNDATCSSRWSGGNDVAHGTYTTNTIFAITYDNKYVYWMKDGVIVRSIAANPGLKLYFDSSFNTVGGEIKNIAFGPAGSAGIDSVSCSLSKDNVTLLADSEGDVLDFSSATTTMTILVGGDDDSTNWTYDTVPTGCTIGTGNDTRTFTISAMSADSAKVVITASKVGSIYPNQVKTFSLVKNRGQIGIIPNLSVSSNSFVFSSTAASTASITIAPNGTVGYESGGSNLTANYYKPTTTNIASTWWVRFTKTGGDTITGLSAGVWYQISSNRTWNLVCPGGTPGHRDATGVFHISKTSGGAIVSSIGASFSASVEDGS